MDRLGVILKHLKVFVSGWDGEALGPDGLVHVLNAGGSRPPLVWCFNARSEFTALAEALGPKQPVIGLRSLNVLVDYRKRSTAADALVAAHYVRILRDHVDLSRCWVGGNCQGASVASEMAGLLVRKGCVVRAFISMEWTPFMPFPGHCALVFGSDSRDFNPFLGGRDPWPMWRHMFGATSCHSLPGDHATYFKPERVRHLARLLRQIMAMPPVRVRRSAEREPLVVEPPPERVGADEPVPLLVARRCLDRLDSRLYAVWIPDMLVPHVATLHKPLLSAAGPCILMRAPVLPGRWTLHVFDCVDGHGPRDWHQQIGKGWTIDVTAPWAAAPGTGQ
ncbi:hypothetical protein ACM64Y_16695 [Novispirillum sp. DQ9]|uniref:hypothetical protein n=1 Tax=Novispirillum sp. DQ9 TaxID=3398612 RepID=UPI003C7CBC01